MQAVWLKLSAASTAGSTNRAGADMRDSFHHPRAGQPAAAIGPARAAAIARGWLDAEPDRLRASPSGLEKLNKLLELFA